MFLRIVSKSTANFITAPPLNSLQEEARDVYRLAQK